MTALRVFLSRLMSMFRRRDSALDEDIRTHLDMLTAEHAQLGMSPEQARFAARRAFGGVTRTQEAYWAQRTFGSLEILLQEMRLTIRNLRRSPGFALTVVLTLALGIGANSAMFSVADSLLLRPLPVLRPDRLAILSGELDEREGRVPAWSYPVWRQVERRTTTFGRAFAWSMPQFNLAERGESHLVEGLYASGDFFGALGVQPFLGRVIAPEDDVLGGGPMGPVAVVSHAYWQRRFGGDAAVVGQPLTIERVPFTIVGVAPAGFFGTEIGKTFDIAVPLSAEPLMKAGGSLMKEPAGRWLRVMFRLHDGQASDALTVMLRGNQAEIYDTVMPSSFPADFRTRFVNDLAFAVRPAPAGTSALRQQYEQPVLAIFAVVTVVLLIACVNLTNLLFARAASRRHELALRVAIGASRSRLVRQLMLENVVLAGAGAVAALGVAHWGARALVTQLPPEFGHVFLDLPIDWRMLTFSAGVAAVAIALFGIAPALHATRVPAADALRTHGTGLRATHPAIWSGLVVAQMALALTLVVVAGLLVETYRRLASVPLGLESGHILVVNADAGRIPVSQRFTVYSRLAAAVRALPGVASVGFSPVSPVSGLGNMDTVDIPGIAGGPHGVQVHYVSPSWFAAVGMTLRAGRDFQEADGQDAPRVLVVNEAFVSRFFSHQDAVGESVVSGVGRGRAPRTIVGIVNDAVYRTVRDGMQPTIYAPLAQVGITISRLNLAVRTHSGSPAALAPSVGAALNSVDDDLSFGFRLLDEQIAASLARERLLATLSGVFGALALMLGGIGLYGLTAYGVRGRRTEFGIRLALGARSADVIGLAIRRSLLLIAVGIVVGLASSVAVTRYLEGLLFGVSPFDVPTFIVTSGLLAAAVTVASYFPARRAARVDPMVALRCE